MSTGGVASSPLAQEPARRLITGILEDAEQLLRKELTLAKEETREELRGLRNHAILLGTGGVVLLAGVLLLLASVGLGLAHLAGWPPFAGLGIVGLMTTLAGGTLLASSRSGVSRAVENVAAEGRELHRDLRRDAALLRPAVQGRS